MINNMQIINKLSTVRHIGLLEIDLDVTLEIRGHSFTIPFCAIGIKNN